MWQHIRFCNNNKMWLCLIIPQFYSHAFILNPHIPILFAALVYFPTVFFFSSEKLHLGLLKNLCLCYNATTMNHTPERKKNPTLGERNKAKGSVNKGKERNEMDLNTTMQCGARVCQGFRRRRWCTQKPQSLCEDPEVQRAEWEQEKRKW